MSMSTLDRLRNPAQQAPEASPQLQVISGGTDENALESLSGQLDSLYADIDYLTQKFPTHNVRSLVDFTLSLQDKLSKLQRQAPGSGGAVENLGIIPGNLLRVLSTLDQKTADEATIGVVEVDDAGVISIYNRYESELAGVLKDNAIGKNFFKEVAPCTNNRLFFGRFRQGVESGALDAAFNYTFTYKMKPTPVSIHLYRDTVSSRNFVFVKIR